jgi:hypothetical protein
VRYAVRTSGFLDDRMEELTLYAEHLAKWERSAKARVERKGESRPAT